MALQTIQLADGRALLDAEIQPFISSLRGPVLTAESPDYDESRSVRNGLIDRHPALIVRCSGVADVIDAVNFARANKLLLSVRGGGHNVAGNAVNDGGLVIDLSTMRAVYVNPRAKVVRAQGGATWADVDRETQLFGLATPGGVVSSTGIGGLTLHGGMGWLRRKYRPLHRQHHLGGDCHCRRHAAYGERHGEPGPLLGGARCRQQLRRCDVL